MGHLALDFLNMGATGLIFFLIGRSRRAMTESDLQNTPAVFRHLERPFCFHSTALDEH